jgi:hypothetical protein
MHHSGEPAPVWTGRARLVDRALHSPNTGSAALRPAGTSHAVGRPIMRMHEQRAKGTHEGALVLELTGEAKDNLLYRTHRVLLGLGVQVVETRLRLVGDRVMQTLRLAELDDGALAPRRVSQVLDALQRACAPSVPVERDAVPAVIPVTLRAFAVESHPRLARALRADPELGYGARAREAQPSA